MKHPIPFLLGLAWRYAKGHRVKFVAFITFSVIASAVNLMDAYFVGRMFNAIQAGVPNLWHTVLIYLLALLSIPFVAWAFHGTSRVWERQVAFYIHLQFKRHLLQQVFALPLAWHRDHHSGESIDKINRGTRALFDFSQDLFEPLGTSSRLIGSYIALFLILPAAGVAAIFVTLIAVVSILLYDRILMRHYAELYRRENGVAATVHDYVSNATTVIAMRLEQIGIKAILSKIQQILPIFRKNIVLNEVKWFSISAIIALMNFLILGGYAYFTLQSGATLLVGTLYSLYAYLERVANGFYNVAWQYGQIVERAASVSATQTISQAFDAYPIIRAHPLPVSWAAIEIKNLYFTYLDEKKRRHHLENLHLTLRRGGKIALVGSSGGGKSTTMALLRGIHPAPDVEMTIDAKPMPHGLQHLFDATLLLPQEPEVFADTILYNITMGQKVDKKRLNQAIYLSRFEPVLKRLKKGLLTNIAEKGVNLSGGEKQRLALARGLLMARDYPILLMDEPTSSVDAKNEELIYQRIFEVYGHKTMVASVHRLHMLKLFDLIYLIEDGRMVEWGTLPQLIAKKGIFDSLWQAYFKVHRDSIAN